MLFAVLTALGYAQERTNTHFAREYKGDSVAARVTLAQADCNTDATVPCYIVIDADMVNMTTGTMPAPCAQCTWMDYRTGGPEPTGVTVGVPYWINGSEDVSVSTVTGQFNSSNNQVVAFLQYVSRSIRVTRVGFNIVTPQAASVGDICIYSTAGNLLANTGGFATTAGGIQSANLTTPITLQKGYYYIAQTNSVAITTVTVQNTNATTSGILNAGATKRSVTTANNATAGVCPATMGVLTAQTSVSPGMFIFQP